MSKVLMVIANIVFIIAFALIAKRMRMPLTAPRNNNFPVNENRLYLEAVRLALLHKQVSSPFLRRRLKINKELSDNLIQDMIERGIIVAPDEKGIAQTNVIST